MNLAVAEFRAVNPSSGFAQISTAAVRGLACTNAVDVDVFLPGADRKHEAVLYYGKSQVASDVGTDSPQSMRSVDFDRLSAHGVTHLLVRAEDLMRCEQALELRLRDMLANPLLSSNDRAEIVHSAGTAVAREILASALSTDSIARASALIDGIVDGVMNDENVAGYILQMAGHERSTASHMQMVATLAVVLGAEVFGDDVDVLRTLALAGMLHDVGKLSVPASTLHKRGPLSEHEVQLIQQHPIESVRLIGRDPTVSPAVRHVILQHHERLDGRGYPLGLADRDILPLTRLLSIVDSFHALIGPRAYRAALSVQDANRVMGYQAGRQFDRAMLERWINLCERHDAALPDQHRSRPSSGDDASARHEHLPARRSRSTTRQRRPRYVCAGKKAVRCIYAGRLAEVSDAPNEFGADVCDISQGGMCIYAAHPMYRGEVLCVQMPTGNGSEWLRSMVTWCSARDAGVYRVGLKFLGRMDERELREPTDVAPMGGYPISNDDADEAENARQTRPADSQAPRRAAPESRCDEAIDRLNAIAAMEKVDGASERAVIVLSTSRDPQVRLRAIEVLAQLDSPSAQGALIALLHDPVRDVRLRAIDLVAACGVSEAITTLRELLEDADETVVLTAAGALGTLKDWSGLRYVTGALLDDGPNTRLAVRAFSRITGEQFPANRAGAASARRYFETRKQEILRQLNDVEALSI